MPLPVRPRRTADPVPTASVTQPVHARVPESREYLPRSPLRRRPQLRQEKALLRKFESHERSALLSRCLASCDLQTRATCPTGSRAAFGWNSTTAPVKDRNPTWLPRPSKIPFKIPPAPPTRG